MKSWAIGLCTTAVALAGAAVVVTKLAKAKEQEGLTEEELAVSELSHTVSETEEKQAETNVEENTEKDADKEDASTNTTERIMPKFKMPHPGIPTRVSIKHKR